MPKRKSTGSGSDNYNSSNEFENGNYDNNNNNNNNKKTTSNGEKKKSTRTRKIPKSCAVCHFRKVRCDQLVPACSACRRHAKTLGQDPDAVKCEYATTSAVRINRALSSPSEDIPEGALYQHVKVESSTTSTSSIPSNSNSSTSTYIPAAPKQRPKRKNRRRVIVDRTSSESEEQELDDYKDDGIFAMEGMGTSQDLRRSVASSSSSRGFSSASLSRATPPPPLSLLLPPLLLPERILNQASRESSPLSDIKRSPSPSTEENPIFYPPNHYANYHRSPQTQYHLQHQHQHDQQQEHQQQQIQHQQQLQQEQELLDESEIDGSEMASPASTTFEIETPLPTPQIEVSGFDFPTESDTEVVQQDYDSLEFGFPENISPGGRSRSGTIMFTPSLSGLTAGDGQIPLWAT